MHSEIAVSTLIPGAKRVAHRVLGTYHCATVSGPDAERYLHGRVTQNIKEIAPDKATASLLLNPQGKILSKFRLKRSGDDFLLLTEPGNGWEDFERDLLQFKVADQLELKKLEDATAVLLLAEEASFLEQSIIELGGDRLSFGIYRYGELFACQILFLNESEKVAAFQNTTLLREEQLSSIEFERIRICSKQAIAGIDLNNKNIATEITIEDLISFNKGCYAGQEVVEMSIARGRPNRVLSSFVVESREGITADAKIETAEGKTAGYLTSSVALDETHSVALGFMKTALIEDEAKQALTVEGNPCQRLA